jgi:predicted acylesterase/phospholipase RssA
MTKVKKGLVLSTGGAWGAFGAGTLARLDKKYDVVAGISTGAMMSPLAALGEHDALKEAYTSVSDKNIFDKKWYRPKPITKKGTVNVFAVIYSLIFKKNTLATTNAMRKTIDKFIKEEHYNKLIEEDRCVIVGAQNLREKPSNIHYFHVKDVGFEDFKDWMWASASAPFYTSLINKEWIDENGDSHMGQWTDGGLTELVALDEVFKRGAKEIDVIVHKTYPSPNYDIGNMDTLIDNVNRSIDAMRYDIEFEYLIEKAKYFASRRKTKTNIYFLPRRLSNSAMMFNKQQMEQWWQEGYDTALDEDRIIRFEPKK